jgi:hypothetical protein
MKRSVIVFASTVAAGTAVLGVIACGPASTGGLGPAPSAGPASAGSARTASAAPAGTVAPTPRSAAPSAPVATPGARTIALQAWFSRGGRLFETWRTVPATTAVGAASVSAVLAGPNSPEVGAGLRSAVPAGTSLLGLNIAKGVATVDLSSQFAASASAGTASLRLAQIVYTLTQFGSVRRLVFHVDGRAVTTIAGLSVTGPQTRAAYAGDLPAIVVASPAIGGRLTSPVIVSGTADVFEAVVSIRILNSAGKEIARTFTTASCGTGCRGDYSVAVPYSVSSVQRGTVEVYESSVQTGSPVNVQRIPVTLAP